MLPLLTFLIFIALSFVLDKKKRNKYDCKVIDFDEQDRPARGRDVRPSGEEHDEAEYGDRVDHDS